MYAYSLRFNRCIELDSDSDEHFSYESVPQLATVPLEQAPLAAQGDALADRTNRVGSAAGKRKCIELDSDSDENFS